eukprot:TRINITY_DN7157_c1_g1_i1.p1 TRINITY_DN7157_c1_g1~~TRINITY_DN7157_c1_g1_i1.p1  ORF type:complete len:340 (-),score=63.48 TRINITY_DN7157_c1_g1_i1:33-1052(-)
MISNSNSCFSYHNFLVDNNGDVFVFGYNYFNQCSKRRSVQSYSYPTKIMKNPQIKCFSLGNCTSFYLERNGNLYGCGENTKKQLGIDKVLKDGFNFISSNVKQVFASGSFTVIQKDDEKIYLSGYINRRHNNEFIELDIDNVTFVSVGSDHCLFIKKNGEVWSYGNNRDGKCGFGVEVEILQKPTLLCSDKNLISVSCGFNYSFILTRNDNGNTILKGFGNNSTGQLGLGNNKYFFGLSNIVDSFPNIVSVHSGGHHSFILLDNGEVYGSGSNSSGQLSLVENTQIKFHFSKTTLSDISFITTGYKHSIFVNSEFSIKFFFFVFLNSFNLIICDPFYFF